MKYLLNNREIQIDDTEFLVGEGCYVHAAHYIDTGADLNDAELDEVSRLYADVLYEIGYENYASRAYDLYKDRMKYGDD